MDLSVIIVNFNTKDLLRQCLNTLMEANDELMKANKRMEVFVVDNASIDGSTGMVKQFFPQVKLIVNKKNLGFGKAHNQALKKASGRYFLCLNSDTEIYPGTLNTMISFMDRYKDVGAATCWVELPDRTLDPACHRGFPTPWASFTYYAKLEKLFSESRLFGRYHMTYLDTGCTHEVDAISGTFFMVRKKAALETGFWDEDYFMYGEDIDWCYRLKERGWKVVFYPKAKILHRKKQSGIEKTNRGQITPEVRKIRTQTTKHFFDAMRIFYEKHYRKKYPAPVTWLVLGGIKLMEKIRLLRTNG